MKQPREHDIPHMVVFEKKVVQTEWYLVTWCLMCKASRNEFVTGGYDLAPYQSPKVIGEAMVTKFPANMAGNLRIEQQPGRT